MVADIDSNAQKVRPRILYTYCVIHPTGERLLLLQARNNAHFSVQEIHDDTVGPVSARADSVMFHCSDCTACPLHRYRTLEKSVCWFVFTKLTQAIVFWEERTSTEKISSSNQFVGKQPCGEFSWSLISGEEGAAYSSQGPP